ncbi:MAG TPA: HD domain-containing protein, partial [Ktedonobacteraceae bacterium]|nr:HD domain-containing protein [Ktedonobacteraceae bacterium]
MIERPVAEDRTQQPYADAMARLLTLVRPYMAPDEMGKVIRAFHLALETCQGVTGTRPIPPLEHALAVTTILAQMMHVDDIGIAAGLVFEAVDADLLPLDRVEQVLGAPTARVVGSMWRLNILERKKQSAALSNTNPQLMALKKAHDEREDTAANSAESKKPRIREAMRRQQSETVRKMFVAMAEDPRVVLLKLAYRLHAMRLICKRSYKGDRQEMLTMAQETREIYAPLAGRLGMSRVESELEDLAFQVLEPDKFAWVRNIVEMERKQWRSYVERVCTMLRAEMVSIGVKAEVSGRVKHYYSFYKKLVRSVSGEIKSFKDLRAAAEISQIHDLIAFRILVDTTTDCYIALGHVHSLWKPKEGRIK